LIIFCLMLDTGCSMLVANQMNIKGIHSIKKGGAKRQPQIFNLQSSIFIYPSPTRPH
jgi:hypothetical protein